MHWWTFQGRPLFSYECVHYWMARRTNRSGQHSPTSQFCQVNNWTFRGNCLLLFSLQVPTRHTHKRMLLLFILFILLLCISFDCIFMWFSSTVRLEDAHGKWQTTFAMFTLGILQMFFTFYYSIIIFVSLLKRRPYYYVFFLLWILTNAIAGKYNIYSIFSRKTLYFSAAAEGLEHDAGQMCVCVDALHSATCIAGWVGWNEPMWRGASHQ